MDISNILYCFYFLIYFYEKKNNIEKKKKEELSEIENILTI